MPQSIIHSFFISLRVMWWHQCWHSTNEKNETGFLKSLMESGLEVSSYSPVFLYSHLELTLYCQHVWHALYIVDWTWILLASGLRWSSCLCVFTAASISICLTPNTAFPVGAGDSNMGPHVCEASNLPTELSFQAISGGVWPKVWS